MTLWRTDVENAPKDCRVILATSCKKTLVSRWLEPNGKDRKVGRWEFLGATELPRAWTEFPGYPEGLE